MFEKVKVAKLKKRSDWQFKSWNLNFNQKRARIFSYQFEVSHDKSNFHHITEIESLKRELSIKTHDHVIG